MNEYCGNTKQDRKHAIKRFNYKLKSKETRKNRACFYASVTITVLIEIWKIFDHPCGQRLEEILETETENLRAWKEIDCSDEISSKSTGIFVFLHKKHFFASNVTLHADMSRICTDSIIARVFMSFPLFVAKLLFVSHVESKYFCSLRIIFHPQLQIRDLSRCVRLSLSKPSNYRVKM